MKKVIEILKGLVVGIANIIPGVSGGTLAIVMGIYNDLIDAVDNFFKTPIKVLKKMWPIILGVVIGIGSSIIGISALLEKSPIITTMLFVGFMVGVIPLIIKDVDGKKVEKKDIISFGIFFILIVMIPFLPINMSSSANLNNFFINLIVGGIIAFSIVVPGVSGSMLLMAMGYYKPLTELASTTIKAALKFDFNLLFSNALIIIPFGIGAIIGIVLTAKLMKFLISKYPKAANWGILGLIVASPFPIIIELNLRDAGVLNILVGIVAFVIGFLAPMLTEKLNKSNKK